MIAGQNPIGDFKKFELSNGLRVLLRTDHSLPLAALQVWVRCGSVDEDHRVAGIAHFMEHMVFKGNPNTRDISRIVESCGGTINAATQHELTHYYTDVPQEGLEPAVTALGEALTSPHLLAEEIEKERRVILEEMARRDDSPNAVLWDKFMGSIYEGTPYGQSVIGSRKTLCHIERRHLAEFHKKNYTASRMVAVCAGDFSERRILSLMESAFGNLPKGKEESNGLNARAFGRAGRPIVLKRPVQQGYLACGFHTPGLSNPDLVTLDVMADLLGGGASSRLYRRLREERQLLWSVGANLISYRHSGILGIFAEVPRANLDESITAIQQEMDGLEKEPVTEPEIQRAKARIRSEWLNELETLHGQASLIGHLTALGQEEIALRYLKDLETIDGSDIQATCLDILKDKPMTVAMIRPKNNSKKS